MCFIHVLHTCASCALYAHGRIVGLLGLVLKYYGHQNLSRRRLETTSTSPQIPLADPVAFDAGASARLEPARLVINGGAFFAPPSRLRLEGVNYFSAVAQLADEPWMGRGKREEMGGKWWG